MFSLVPGENELDFQSLGSMNNVVLEYIIW